MSDDILKFYKSMGSNQEAGTSSFKNICNNKPSEKDSSSITSFENKINKSKEALKFQQNLKNSPTPMEDLSFKDLKNTASSYSLKRSSDLSTDFANRRKREKCSKGLRHFSMKVCEKVRQKGVTTYNEVADELVQEYCSLAGEPTPLDYWSYDQKNVRRRVYDALNVLMAMNIISKEKKEIRWIGLPCNKKQECQELELERTKKLDNIKMKSELLKEHLVEFISTKLLLQRNKESSKVSLTENDNSHPDNDKLDVSIKEEIENTKVNNETRKFYSSKYSSSLRIPFIVVTTGRNTNVDCNISNDKKDYTINFDSTFEVHSYMEILQKLGLTLNLETGSCTDIGAMNKACTFLPEMFSPYIHQMANQIEIKAVNNLPTLPNFSSNRKVDATEVSKDNKENCKSEDLDMNELYANDERIEFSGDSLQSDSDENSLNYSTD